MKFFNRNSDLIQELREQLSSAEDTNLSLQNQVQREREEKTNGKSSARSSEGGEEQLQVHPRRDGPKKCTTPAELKQSPRRRTKQTEQEGESHPGTKRKPSQCQGGENRSTPVYKRHDSGHGVGTRPGSLKAQTRQRGSLQRFETLQNELEQQHQLRKARVRTGRAAKQQMQENMLQMKEKMTQLEKDLLQSQVNLEKQKQETRTTTDRAEMIQTQLKDETERSKGLQEQVTTLRAAFATSEENIVRLEKDCSGSQTKANLEQQKQETQTALDRAELIQTQLKDETERSKSLQEQVTTLRAAFATSEENIVRLEKDLLQTKANLEQQKKETQTTLDRAELIQTQFKEETERSKGLQEQEKTEERETRRKLEDDRQTDDEARVSVCERSGGEVRAECEKEMKELLQKLNVKESETQQQGQKIESLEKEVQSLTEACKILQEEVVKQAQDQNEEVQSLKATCSVSEEAERVVVTEIEQEEVESLRTAQDVTVSETEKETTSTEWKKQTNKRHKQNPKPIQPRQNKTSKQTKSQNLQSKKTEKVQVEVQTTNKACQISEEALEKNNKKLQKEVESLKTAQDVKVSELKEGTTTQTEQKEQKTKKNKTKQQPEIDIDLIIRDLDQQIRQAEEAKLGASLEKNKKKTRASGNQKKQRNKRHKQRPHQRRQHQTKTENPLPKIETGETKLST
ncbi:hypothetical protein WMY93_002914 [Mugilogobius chulae]|uniref:Trichohyalin-like n=1 Tax=Mugilogobius chulae TaxID=88201 RepID=A0AAW0PUU7_9GOBI